MINFLSSLGINVAIEMFILISNYCYLGALGRVATATMQYSNIQLPEEDYLDVMVTHVTNPNEFCCQLLENSDKIDELMADLEHNYHSSKQSRNMTLKNGMPCVALYSGIYQVQFSISV